MYKVGIYRIIGNDLMPRCKKNQSYENLKFILENEPEHSSFDKKWVLNRLVNKSMLKKLVSLLDKHKRKYTIIPFGISGYRDFLRKTGNVTIDDKVRYIINLNKTRNFALEAGAKNHEWICLLDGNDCLTSDGMKQLLDKIDSTKQAKKYYFISKYMLMHNSEYFDFDRFKYHEEEPLILLNRNSHIRFDESLTYGKDSKVELINRIGNNVVRTKNATIVTDKEFLAGYALRLFSGIRKAELSLRCRVNYRKKGIRKLVRKVDISLQIYNIMKMIKRNGIK